VQLALFTRTNGCAVGGHVGHDVGKHIRHDSTAPRRSEISQCCWPFSQALTNAPALGSAHASPERETGHCKVSLTSQWPASRLDTYPLHRRFSQALTADKQKLQAREDHRSRTTLKQNN